MWRYFAEDGTLQSEGEFVDGKKNGPWTTYFPSGKVASKGITSMTEPTGKWENFFEDGTISSAGEFDEGKKDGYWKSFTAGGKLKSEVTYDKGSGEYREYYENGKLKVKGQN